MKPFLLILFSFVLSFSFAQNSTLIFDVSYNGSKIGTLTASKVISGHKETIDIKTNTDAKVLVMSVHVESEINMEKENAVMKKGIAYRHSNRGSENVLGFTQKIGKKYLVNINHKPDTIHRENITFCVSDLYFKEPAGLSEIYSNMYGSFVPVSHTGNNRYKVTMPDGKLNYYTYQKGQLDYMEVELTIGKITSKRRE